MIAKIFVFGTLKRGYINNLRFLDRALSTETAWVWGRLYGSPQRGPTLVIDYGQILAKASCDYIADVLTQERLPKHDFVQPVGDFDLVQGELMTIDCPLKYFPCIDGLEGFHPLEESWYQRVLTTVKSDSGYHNAWFYTLEPKLGYKRIQPQNGVANWHSERYTLD